MSDNARFELKSQGLEVVIEGNQEFVSGQLELMRSTIEAELKAARAVAEQTAAGGATAAPAAAPTSAPAAAAPATPAAAAPAEPAAAKAAPKAESAPAEKAPKEELTLEAFYRKNLRRKGRGMIQDSILLFAYFLREHRGIQSITTENVNACFALVGEEPPSHLANTLGLMKRNKGYFDSPSRGHYSLTEEGTAKVERMKRGY